MTKKFFKTIAMALAAVTISLPLSTQALAASHHDASPASRQNTRVEMRRDEHKAPAPAHKVELPRNEHKNVPMHAPAPAPKEKEHHSDTGNFVTGAIVGAILGAVIANNT